LDLLQRSGDHRRASKSSSPRPPDTVDKDPDTNPNWASSSPRISPFRRSFSHLFPLVVLGDQIWSVITSGPVIWCSRHSGSIGDGERRCGQGRTLVGHVVARLPWATPVWLSRSGSGSVVGAGFLMSAKYCVFGPPWFILVKPLALLFYDALVSFCVFMFCRSISKELQNSCGIAWKIRKFWRTRSIEFCPKSIDRNFQEHTFAKARQNTQSEASSWQKAVLPLIFAAKHAGFVTLIVYSNRGTLEGVKRVILHGFLALISFYKSHSHTSLLEEFREL
jgi:hypothetical protein